MGKVSDNPITFSKPGLRAIERRVDPGEFTNEFYLYDTDSHWAIGVRPNQSYTGTGRGKTHLATAIGVQGIQQHAWIQLLSATPSGSKKAGIQSVIIATSTLPDMLAPTPVDV